MFWVLVFGGIALAGVVMVVCYGVWLAHKAADVMSELGMVSGQLGRLGALVAQIQPTPYARSTEKPLDERPTDHGFGSEPQTYDEQGVTPRHVGKEE